MRHFVGSGLVFVAGIVLALPHPFFSRGDAPSEIDLPGVGTGDICATGCAAIPRTQTALERADFERWIADFAETGASDALDGLLFHGVDTLVLLDEETEALLGPERTAFLRTELSRTQAILDVRLIDERGIERMRLGGRRIPLNQKQHLFPDQTDNLEPPEISGTLRRVGREHLWVRL